MFGLHPNAEIGFLTNQGISIFMTITELTGGSGGGGGGDIGAAQEIIELYQGQLPPNMDMLEIRGRLKEEDYVPYIIVVLQESDRMNLLLNKLRSSMTELELGISGALNVTEAMKNWQAIYRSTRSTQGGVTWHSHP
jgi:dynein heavy chain